MGSVASVTINHAEELWWLTQFSHSLSLSCRAYGDDNSVKTQFGHSLSKITVRAGGSSAPLAEVDDTLVISTNIEAASCSVLQHRCSSALTFLRRSGSETRWLCRSRTSQRRPRRRSSEIRSGALHPPAPGRGLAGESCILEESYLVLVFGLFYLLGVERTAREKHIKSINPSISASARSVQQTASYRLVGSSWSNVYRCTARNKLQEVL